MDIAGYLTNKKEINLSNTGINNFLNIVFLTLSYHRVSGMLSDPNGFSHYVICGC